MASDRVAGDSFGRGPLYTNVEDLAPEQAEVYLRLNLDTWYFDALSGSLSELGHVDYSQASAARAHDARAFLAEQVQAFLEACRLVLPPVSLHIAYQPRPSVPEGREQITPLAGRHLGRDDVLGLLDQVGAPAQFVSVRCDTLATIRDVDGGLKLMRFPHTAYARFHADAPNWRRALHPESASAAAEEEPGVPAPYAGLECYVFSLFRPTNAEVLAGIRAAWRGGRTSEDTRWWMGEGVVTLIEPPSGTPSDNGELYDHNAPGLHAAIAQWERAAGGTFHWTVST
jgi:hypothetical protein